MTIASLLLALITATNAPSQDASSDPILLDFHAHWCGPCRQMRPAVKELIQNGYPVKSIDIDKAPAWRERYGVSGVPTFIVVDRSGRELDRTSGAQPVAALERFYVAARDKAQAEAKPPDHSNAHVGARQDDRGGEDGNDDDPPARRPRARRDDVDEQAELKAERSETAFTNPHPSETIVRIRVLGPHSVGFGSGTIIHSSPRESLIVTCAHIFKLEGRQKQVSPRQFPRRIMIDLFDGKLRGTNPAQVHFLEAVEGEAVDYDFSRDVGLIRIRPGRRLPASRVVPAHWEPKSQPRPMKMLTVGCSEGQDATAWHTIILNPRMQGLSGNPSYEAIECWKAPKQGRSGGGLFTTDGYLAGICNFAEPRGDHGLYATPRSIYSLLDRNGLMALYAPVSRGSGTLVAEGRQGARSPRGVAPIARSQSPDREEAEPGAGAFGNGDVMLPHPSLLGIANPVSSAGEGSPSVTSGPTHRVAWHPTRGTSSVPEAQSLPKAEPTDLNLDPSADHDRFGPPPIEWRAQAAGTDREGNLPASGSGSTAGSPARPRWRAVKPPAPAAQGL
jgi:thiol-disulfide isomerase/thioredoxin